LEHEATVHVSPFGNIISFIINLEIKKYSTFLRSLKVLNTLQISISAFAVMWQQTMMDKDKCVLGIEVSRNLSLRFPYSLRYFEEARMTILKGVETGCVGLKNS
jgi:hypothetical protein